MVSLTAGRPASARRSLSGVLLGGTLALFLGATLADVAYATTYEIQWLNFAAWLLVGALVFATLALVPALFDLLRPARQPRANFHAGALALAWVTGVLSALMHAKDAWASMPEGLVLSALATVLVLAAAWLALAPGGDRT